MSQCAPGLQTRLPLARSPRRPIPPRVVSGDGNHRERGHIGPQRGRAAALTWATATKLRLSFRCFIASLIFFSLLFHLELVIYHPFH